VNGLLSLYRARHARQKPPPFVEVELLTVEKIKRHEINQGNSEPELQVRSLRAMSIDVFCDRYGLGRTLAYEEIKAGRLRARKVGRRTLIAEDDAEDWLKSLPPVRAKL
jgi:excisionase family DNA binding protein